MQFGLHAWLQVAPFNSARIAFAFPPIATRIDRHDRRVCSCKAAVALEKLLLSAVSGPEGIWGALAADIAAHRDGLPLRLLAWLLVILAAEEGVRVRTIGPDAALPMHASGGSWMGGGGLDLSASLRQSSRHRSQLSVGASSTKRCGCKCGVKSQWNSMSPPAVHVVWMWQASREAAPSL